MAGTSPASVERHTSSPWNTTDDNQLMHARQKGLNWQPIASTYFPNKTPNACRKRHERLMEKRNSADTWDGGKIEQLAKAYTEVREEMWGLLAKRVDEKWQDVERKCMEKGLKTLLNVSRTVARREQRRDSHDPADHDDPQHEPTMGGTGYRRGPSSLMSLPEESSNALEGDTLIEEPPHASHLPYNAMRDDLSYSRVGAEEKRLHSYSISGEDRPARYGNGVPIPTHPYNPPSRSYSTSSSATTFTPVSATAPSQHQQTLPRISSLDGMDGILNARPQIPPILRPQPVTTH